MSLRVAVAAVFFVSVGTWADIAPPNTQSCAQKQAGATCVMDDGSPGTCVATMVRRPDYSGGMPPKMTEREILICTGSAKALARDAVSAPWPYVTTALVALLAGAALFFTRRRPVA